ncbi:MAG: Rpn family recombination-promoting nuclease/putative transposase [Planctomycetaceae bacterium]|jgi:predicted transposase/invertase (TIGR01784 family)|nr:Rpn family recombination-promoting nuclease/putative transposase [Planctomycetaceae bacterium]
MGPLGIRPTNDFAFLKTFGTPANKIALVSLLNAILDLRNPIVDLRIENPFNTKDFMDDKLSILDIKASDQRGWIYDVEMQISVAESLVQRLVYYGCRVYVDQLRSGDDYLCLKPVFTICLIEDKLWKDSTKVHHAFRFADLQSGKILSNTPEIHTLELGWYNLDRSELAEASLLDRWLFWLRHAHEFDLQTLRNLFPQPAFLKATDTIDRIARITEDKDMYDAREKKLRDQQWLIRAGLVEGREQGRQEGLVEGRQEGRQEGIQLGELIGLIRFFQRQLGICQSPQEALAAKDPLELKALASELETQFGKKSI